MAMLTAKNVPPPIPLGGGFLRATGRKLGNLAVAD